MIRSFHDAGGRHADLHLGNLLVSSAGDALSVIDLDRCERFCKRLREAVGTRADLLFGTHGQFTASGAEPLSDADTKPFAALAGLRDKLAETDE